jgi:MFS family permease
MGLGIAIGFMVAPGLFESNGDWAATMSWLSTLSFVALALTLVMAFGPKPPTDHSITASSSSTGNDSEFKQALQQPATWAAIGCVVWLGWVMQGFNDLVPAYIAIPSPVGLGKGPMEAGKFMTALQFAFMTGATLSGFITEKIFGGRSKPIVFLGFLGFTVFAFSIKLPAVTSNDSTLLICLILAGFFQSLCIPPSIAFIARNYPEHLTGRLGGLAQGLSVFGGTAGVFAGAYALHTTGLYMMSINIVLIIALIGCIFALGQNPPETFSVTDKKPKVNV